MAGAALSLLRTKAQGCHHTANMAENRTSRKNIGGEREGGRNRVNAVDPAGVRNVC